MCNDNTPAAGRSAAAGPRLFKAIGQRLALVLASLLISGLLAEAAFRLVLASDTRSGRQLKNPRLYADPFSDDLFWLLRQRWQGHFPRFRPPGNPHPLLGWHAAHIDPDYSHRLEAEIAGRRPVLLYGDSFAQGMPGVERFQEIVNADPEFARGHYLLNYGVGGYGVDQIYLLFENSVDRFEDPFVIFSLMTFDLDRSVLSVRIGQKPYFELVEGRLELRGVPVDSDPEAFFAAHPPRVGSYLLRRLSQLPFLAGDEKSTRATAKKKKINGAILEEAIDRLEARGLDYVIFVFHARKAFRSGPDWRSSWLRSLLDEKGVPYMWSYDILQQEAADLPLDELFDPGNVHPTSLANQIFGRAMAQRALLAARDPGGDD